ncbi:hypothetical protein [Nitratifractor sp.]
MKNERLSEKILQAFSSMKEEGVERADALRKRVEGAVGEYLEQVEATDEELREAIRETLQELRVKGSIKQIEMEETLNGILGAIEKETQEKLSALDYEMLKLKLKAEEERLLLAQRMKRAAQGAREAAKTFEESLRATLQEKALEIETKAVELQNRARQESESLGQKAADFADKVIRVAKAAYEGAVENAKKALEEK